MNKGQCTCMSRPYLSLQSRGWRIGVNELQKVTRCDHSHTHSCYSQNAVFTNIQKNPLKITFNGVVKIKENGSITKKLHKQCEVEAEKMCLL